MQVESHRLRKPSVSFLFNIDGSVIFEQRNGRLLRILEKKRSGFR